MKNLTQFSLNPTNFGCIFFISLTFACTDFDNNPILSGDDGSILALSTTAEGEGPLVEPTLREIGSNLCDPEIFSESMSRNFFADDGELMSEIPEGFDFTFEYSNISWSFTPFADQNGITQTLGEVEVQVLGWDAFGLSVYHYEENFFSEYEAIGDKGLSDLFSSRVLAVSLCYNLVPDIKEEIEPCLRGRHSAWTEGTLFDNTNRGNWATYTDYEAGATIDIVTRKNILVGTATFGPIENGEVTIAFDLQGAKFANGRENIKVLAYNSPPTSIPRFNPKLNTVREKEETETTATIVVPASPYYAINLNIVCSDAEE